VIASLPVRLVDFPNVYRFARIAVTRDLRAQRHVLRALLYDGAARLRAYREELK
jgi:hypothetical protein